MLHADNGQLGVGTSVTFFPGGQTTGTVSYSAVPLEVGSQTGGMTGWTSVYVGGDGTAATVCGIRGPTGQAYCWGYNSNGEIGDGTSNSPQPLVQLVQNLPSGVAKLYMQTGYNNGNWNMARIAADGSVWTWGHPGNSGSAQLGRDTTVNPNDVASPVMLFSGDSVGLKGIVDVVYGGAAGYGTTCALHRNGTVYCWGYNNFGSCGVGSSAAWVPYATPINYPQNFLARKIFGGVGGYGAYFCAIHAVDSGVYCWGMYFFELELHNFLMKYK